MNLIIFCSWSLSGRMKPLLRRQNREQNRGHERILIRWSPRSTIIRKFPWTTGLHVQRVISGSFVNRPQLRGFRWVNGSNGLALNIHGLDGSGSGWISMSWMDLDLDLDGYPWDGWIWIWMDIHLLDGSGSGWISMGWMDLDLDLDGYPWDGWIWIWMDIHGLDGPGSGWISMG